MTDYKISQDGKTRIETMVRTHNGSEIADVDLKLRGPGDLMGTQQSGVLDLSIADLGTDGKILQAAREAAKRVLENDPELIKAENFNIRRQVDAQGKNMMNWSRVS
jgi:ATP-dependent DNA helicase RecG